MPDSLIFDLDGTLWDTSATCADAWNRVVARLGIVHRPITVADIAAVTGRPHIEGLHTVFAALEEADIQRLIPETEAEDNRAVAEHGGALYPGVREHIPLLRARVPLMIVSNCQRGYIEAFLSWSRLGPHFVDFECWGNTGRRKSDNLAAVIERNRLRRPLFIGDTEGDREAARDNGVRFVHVSYGFGAVVDCDHRLDRFADLAALLDP